MIDRLLTIMAPHSCCGCGYLGTILCPQCKDDIVSEPFARCLVCLKPTSVNNLCPNCSARLPYAAAWCVGTREGSLKALLDRYKFDSARQAGTSAAELLDARLPVLAETVTVVPVPTAPAHQRVRGFDHMALVATRLARLRRLAISKVLVSDRNDTQHFKSRQQRQAAARQGLRIRGPVPQSILLIDDIYTTGSTVRACAELLRQRGANDVSVAILARQTLDESRDL